jgi:hypothetical protein
MYADIRSRNDGIDAIARTKAARDILAAARDLDQKPDGGSLGAEEGLHTRAAFPTDRCHLNDAAVRIHCHHRDDAAIGEEDVIERTIGIHENLAALAANVFKLRHKSRDVARWQRK